MTLELPLPEDELRFSYVRADRDDEGQVHRFIYKRYAQRRWFDSFREDPYYPVVMAWCAEQFDPMPPLDVGSRWYANRDGLFFSGDDDAFVFRMRWC